jgi:hypothetical protein
MASTRVTQLGADNFDIEPVRSGESRRVLDEGYGGFLRDLSNSAREYEAAEEARIIAEGGTPPKRLNKYFFSPLGQGLQDLGIGVSNLAKTVPYALGADVEFKPAFGVEPYEPAKQVPSSESAARYTLDDYLRGNQGVLDIEGQMARYEQNRRELRGLLGLATVDTSGAYNAAAAQGRRTGENIGTRGQRAGDMISGYYGDAGEFAGDMSQAGGTSVSGLTGPSSAFQAIYGDAYGTGTGLSEGTRAAGSLAEQDMMAEAQRAAGMSGKATKNLENYWKNMTANERLLFGNALAAQKSAATTQFNQLNSAVSSSIGNLRRSYRNDEKVRNDVKKSFPGVNSESDLVAYIQNIQRTQGPQAALEELSLGGFGVTQGG